MNTVAAKDPSFQPIHDAHAIEQVAFVVQVDQPIEILTLKDIITYCDQNFASDLPKHSEIRGVSVEIGAGSPNPTGSMEDVGKLYRRIRPDGRIENELRIDRTGVVFRTTSYTRWAQTWERAKGYLKNLAPMLLTQNRNLATVGLNYVDRFYWDGEISECDPKKLLREGSDYLCPHVLKAQDLWHSHTGSFIKIDSKIKRLMNLNIDFIDAQIKNKNHRLIAIGTVLTDLLNQNGYEKTDVNKESVISFIDSRMNDLHQFGKITFANVINDAMSARIALTK